METLLGVVTFLVVLFEELNRHENHIIIVVETFACERFAVMAKNESEVGELQGCGDVFENIVIVAVFFEVFFAPFVERLGDACVFVAVEQDLCERAVVNIYNWLDTVRNVAATTRNEFFEFFEDAFIGWEVLRVFLAGRDEVVFDGVEDGGIICFVLGDDFCDIISIERGGFEVADGANNVFGCPVAAEWRSNFELGLNFANHRETVELIDAVLKVWTMFLEEIGTK